MRLPDEAASDAEWIEFLQDLRSDPKLEGAKNQARLQKRFTAVTVEPQVAGGPTVALHLWEPTGELRTVRSATLSP